MFLLCSMILAAVIARSSRLLLLTAQRFPDWGVAFAFRWVEAFPTASAGSVVAAPSCDTSSTACVVRSVGSGAVSVVRCVDLLVVWSAGPSAVVSHHRATGAGILCQPATRCQLLTHHISATVNPFCLSCRMRPAFPRRRFLSCRLVPTPFLRLLSPASLVCSPCWPAQLPVRPHADP